MLAVRVALAGVFATAGVTKLADRTGARRSLEQFGVPARLSGAGSFALPLCELVIAVGLLITPAARWAGAAALLLLLAFIGAIANALARGRAPDCHCFGQLHSTPAGPATLARNTALAAMALGVLAAGPGRSLGNLGTERTTTQVGLVIVVLVAVVLAALAVRLRTDNRRLREELSDAQAELAVLPAGLPIGASAPEFTLSDLEGEPRTLESLLDRGRPVALVFVSSDCPGCEQMLPEIARWQELLSDRLTAVIISHGSATDNRALAERHGLTDMLVQRETEVLKRYRVRTTPTAVVITPSGRIASNLAEGLVAIEPLVRLILRRAPQAVAADSPQIPESAH